MQQNITSNKILASNKHVGLNLFHFHVIFCVFHFELEKMVRKEKSKEKGILGSFGCFDRHLFINWLRSV